MSKRLQQAFRRALNVAIAMPRDVSAGIGKAYRTLKAYQDGTRAVTLDAARSLSRYLRRRAKQMLKVADALDSAIRKEGQKK